jgi:hypothetical protein
LGVGAYGIYTSITSPSTARSAEEPADDTDESTLPTATTRSGSILSGISPSSVSPTHFNTLRQWLGSQQAVCVFFVDMDQSPDEIDGIIELFEHIWQQGFVPHMFWQPNFGASDGEAQRVTKAVTNGEYDDQLESWASALAEWLRRPADEPDRRAYISLGPEFNGDWVPWAIPTPEATPESYAGMWERTHEIVMSNQVGRDHLQWVLSANNVSSAKIDLSACYPGDDYVDWLGVTGYNWNRWGGWKTPAEIFDRMIDNLREISDRPLAVSEFGCSVDCEEGYCPDRKDQWIHEAYDYFEANDVRLACWFDHTKETEWGVFDTEYGTETVEHDGTSYTAYGEYREALARETILPTHPVDGRRLSDEEFRGEF